MNDTSRLLFSLQHVMGKSVVSFARDEWVGLVDPSGVPTRLSGVPAPFARVASETAVVAVAASGIENRDPGVDIVRHDPTDAPRIYNIDHYVVIEKLPAHPRYAAILRTAGMKPTSDTDAYLRSHVFMVGPYRLDEHRVAEIPARIARARVT